MIHDYGDRALLLDLDGTADVLAWCDAVREADLPGVVDVVPAARTVLLVLAGPRYQAATRARLGGLHVERSEITPADRRTDVTIDVVYDGEDLDEVARLTGLSPDDVVAAHTAAPMRVGFGGFSPASPTWSAVTSGCTFRAAPSLARRFPADPSGWQANSAASTLGRPPAAGS